MANRTANRMTVLWIGAGAMLLILIIVFFTRTLENDFWGIGSPGGALPDSAGSTADDPAADTARVVLLGNLDRRIAESSGVAVSRARENLLWTHNDRGSPPRLFAIGLDGELRQVVDLSGVRVFDLEDIALGDCPVGVDGEGDCLYLADTGDNEARRRTSTVWVVREPASGVRSSVRPIAGARFRYPDRPADTEALALGPDGGVLLVTKGDDGSARLYGLPRNAFDPGVAGSDVEADLRATLPLDVRRRADRITGAASSPDRSQLAVRSHHTVHLFQLSDLGADPVSCPLGNVQPQGEGVDYLSDGQLILTSESPGGRRAPLVRLRCPA